MKKLLFMAIAVVLMQVAARAQDTPPPPPPAPPAGTQPMRGDRQASPDMRAKMQTDRLATALSLTDEQKKNIYDINLKAAQQMQDVQRGDAGSREKMKSINEAKEDRYKKVLTADQMKKYEEMKAQMRQQRMDRRSNNGMNNDGPPPPQGN